MESVVAPVHASAVDLDLIYDAVVLDLVSDAVVLAPVSEAALSDLGWDAVLALAHPDSGQSPAWQSEPHEPPFLRCHLCQQ